MKKHIIFVIILMLILPALSSCNKKEPDNTVKIWMYKQGGTNPAAAYDQIRQMIKDEMTNYAEENDIKIEFTIFTDDELSPEDYALKRNLALEHGDVDIIVDETYNDLYRVANYAGDYTKLKNYEKVFDNFKGSFGIPIYIQLETLILDSDVLKMYGIESEKYISLDEYYNIKQMMKDRGARFKLNVTEIDQLVQYYIIKNNLELEYDDGEFTVDRNNTLQTIKAVHYELLKWYDLEDIDNIYDSNDMNAYIYDETSKRGFSMGIAASPFYPLRFDGLTVNDAGIPFVNYTTVIRDDLERQVFMRRVPCLMINKNTEKNNAYEIVDYLLSDRFQGRMYEKIYPYSTITESTQLKERLGYGNEWNYKYVPGKTKIFNDKLNRNDVDKIIGVVSDTYKMVKNIDTEKYFKPYLWYEPLNLIRNESLKMVQNANYTEEEFDKNIDDFLMNINIAYN